MVKKILKKDTAVKKEKSPTKATVKKVAPKKAVVKKEVVKKKEVSKIASEEYFYGLGKRKTAVAQVRLYSDKSGKGEISVNSRDYKEYFSLERLQKSVSSPLAVVSLEKNFSVKAKVSGGGINAQAEATRLGISRALVKSNEDLRKSLKAEGYLTRDSRKVERKKPGKKKARRSPQWAKR